MGTLKYAAVARQDLVEIWVGIALDNPVAADRIVERIEVACSRLRNHPHLGPARPAVGNGARALIVDHWLALYMVEPEGVQIVRIVDGVRDLTRLDWAPEAG